MSSKRIAVIPGDGIGNEVVPEGIRVLEEAATKFEIDLQFDHLRLRLVGLLRAARPDAAPTIGRTRSAGTTRSSSARSAGPRRFPITFRSGDRCCSSVASSTSTSTCALRG